MRKFQKQQLLDIFTSLHILHQESRIRLEKKEYQIVQTALSDCQEAAIQMGEAIEQIEGEGTEAVAYLEQYCELVYETSVQLEELSAQKIYKKLEEILIKAENAVKHMPVRIEAVFLPYKASMWDSLESVWMAADADPDCDAYVIPIPYYDKDNATGQFTKLYYEADLFPKDVPLTHYDNYNFEQHRPDMIFIHNPYDEYNRVTSVHPFFYSHNLKKFTDCLVYIPYFATAGGMSEAQSLCSAYVHADYIIVQSDKYRGFYDEMVQDKLLPLGSPKFDSVIRKCQNPPEPPTEWKEKMAGKKVYFYNTSLNGMLANTEVFLKKMQYVFDTFAGREDACLLWRPHPLMESSFESMRKEYLDAYLGLKKQFLEKKLGIYDNTPSIEDTIAQCDVYIGDAGTSVTSLFGVVGKPLFILNNRVHEEPKEDSYQYEVYMVPRGDNNNRYCIAQGNKLFFSKNNNFHYEFFCNLSEYAAGNYYSGVYEYEDKVYVFPSNAEEILVIDKNKEVNRITLKHEVEQTGIFAGFGYYVYEPDYMFIYPNKYSSLVRLDMKNGQIDYITGFRDFNVGMVDNEEVIAARWFYEGKLYALNVSGDKLLSIDIKTFEITFEDIDINRCMIAAIMNQFDDHEIWLLPYTGTVVIRWNFITGQKKQYDLNIDGLQATRPGVNIQCEQRMFAGMGFTKDEVIFVPWWGNKFVKLNPDTEKVEELETPFNLVKDDISPYAPNSAAGYFIRNFENLDEYSFFSNPERTTYKFDINAGKAEKIDISFDKNDLEIHESGFCETSQWLQYSCQENSFNSLKDLLDNNITGNEFESEKAIKEFSKINASVNGDCGKRVYDFVKTKGRGNKK